MPTYFRPHTFRAVPEARIAGRRPAAFQHSLPPTDRLRKDLNWWVHELKNFPRIIEMELKAYLENRRPLEARLEDSFCAEQLERINDVNKVLRTQRMPRTLREKIKMLRKSALDEGEKRQKKIIRQYNSNGRVFSSKRPQYHFYDEPQNRRFTKMKLTEKSIARNKANKSRVERIQRKERLESSSTTVDQTRVQKQSHPRFDRPVFILREVSRRRCRTAPAPFAPRLHAIQPREKPIHRQKQWLY